MLCLSVSLNSEQEQHMASVLFQLVLLCLVTNVTLIWWNNIKDHMKIVLEVQFATNQLTNGVKSLKETLTHQTKAVWASPKSSFKNKNCLESSNLYQCAPN